VPRLAKPHLDGARRYPCPIAGCPKVFEGSRGGWDAHVGSLRTHPNWYPGLRSAEDRKNAFENEFPEFFLSQGVARDGS
jgi:hypothetical protein